MFAHPSRASLTTCASVPLLSASFFVKIHDTFYYSTIIIFQKRKRIRLAENFLFLLENNYFKIPTILYLLQIYFHIPIQVSSIISINWYFYIYRKNNHTSLITRLITKQDLMKEKKIYGLINTFRNYRA